jgi:hypothetical protein
MKANIATYIFAMSAKPIFWLVSYLIERQDTRLRFPIDSTLGAALSAMCFTIVHILIIRIVLA